MKKAIKRILALGAGATMIGATIMGAMALTLADYPKPFVTNGMFDGTIVVGEHAATSDVLGAIDIAASLQAASYSTEAVEVETGGITVTGGKDYDEQVLNDGFIGVNLTETKLEGYRDATTDFDDEDVDYHDELIILTDAVDLKTSYADEDFGADIYMTTDASKIMYRVYFDDDVVLDAVDENETLEFYFLGKLITVTDIGDDNTSMRVESSSEYFMEEGDVLTIGEHDVTLVRVGSTSVIVKVDNQQLVIGDTLSKTFDQADDFEVEVDSLFYIEGATDNGAYLKLGASLSESADDGDPVELFGEPSDEDEADWLWNIDMTAGTDQYIGIVNNIDRTDLDATDADERSALAVGESLDLPNGYGGIKFAELEESQYETLTIEVGQDYDLDEGGDGNDISDADGVYFSFASGGDYFEVDGVDTSEVWVIEGADGGEEIWYEDGDDEVNATTTANFTIKMDEDEITVTPPADIGLDMNSSNIEDLDLAFKMDFSSFDELYFFVDVDEEFFGDDEEEEAEELVYSDEDNLNTTIGTDDYDFVTNYGVIIEDPETQFGSGSSFEMQIPANQQFGTIVVFGPNTVIGGATGDATTDTVNPIAVGMAKLDKDVTLGSDNMIIVGGPMANTIAMEVMGNPANPVEFFEQGKAKIVFYPAQNALLVAGYEAMETLGACYVLADYEDYTLTGTEVEVVVTSLSDIQVNPVV